jgi:hypothetical protein
MPRYENRDIFYNTNLMYSELFRDRNIKFLQQYATPELIYPTTEEINMLTNIPHIWKTGDKYYKLSHTHYNKADYWWVIAWYNKKPTESHLKVGDIIYIPKPLEMIFEFLDI